MTNTAIMAKSDANPDWGELIEGLPETEPELLVEVEMLLDEDRYERAEEILDSALRRLPTPDLLKTQGRVQLERNFFERGCSLLEPLCTGRNVDSEALVLYARGKAEMGETETAEECLDRAVDAGAPQGLVEKVKSLIELQGAQYTDDELDSVDHDDETLNIGDAWKRVVRATAERSEHAPGERSDWLTTETFEPRNPDDYVSDSDPTVPERVQATENILGKRDIVEPDDDEPDYAGEAETVQSETLPDEETTYAGEAETVRSDTVPDEVTGNRGDTAPDRESAPDTEDETAEALSPDEPDTEEADRENLFSVSTSRPTTDVEELLLETLTGGDDPEEWDTADTNTDGIRTTRMGMGEVPDVDTIELDPEDSNTVELKMQPLSTEERDNPADLEIGGADSDPTAEASPRALAEGEQPDVPSAEYPVGDEVTNPEVPRAKQQPDAESSGEASARDPDSARSGRAPHSTDGPAREGPPAGDRGAPSPPPERQQQDDEVFELSERIDHEDSEEDDRPWVGGGEPSSSGSGPAGSWKPGHVLEDRSSAIARDSDDRDREPSEQVTSHSAEDEFSAPVEAAGSSSRLRSFVAVLGGMAAVFGLVFTAAGAVTHFDRRSINEKVDEVRAASDEDTYRAWLDAFEITLPVTGEHESRIRTMLHRLGSMVLGTGPDNIRGRVAREQALTAAMVEFRFESCGSRAAGQRIRQYFPAEVETATGAAARTYRNLACGHLFRAVRVARRSAHRLGESRRLTAARLAALLETRDVSGIREQAERLQELLDRPSVYEAYLLARAKARHDPKGALDQLRNLAEERAPDHLDADIALVNLLADLGRSDEALKRGRSLLEQTSSDVPRFQRARLHVAVGRAHASKDDLEGARAVFRTAVELASERAEIHLPAIDLALSQSDLTEAEQLLSDAQSAASMTDRLAERKARLHFLRGEWHRANEALPKSDPPHVGAALMRARLAIQLRNDPDAQKVAASVPEDDPRYPAAEALRLLASTYLGELGERPRRNALVRKMSTLHSNHPKNADVAHTAARLRLRLAQFSTGRERVSHLERGLERAQRATELQPNRARHHRNLCEAYLAAAESDGLQEACRKARELNPDSAAALRTSVRAALAVGELSSAESLLEELSNRKTERWADASLRIRFHLQKLELERAETLLNDWKSRAKGRPSYQLLAGHAAFERGDDEEAVQHYGGVSSDLPVAWEADVYRAHSYARMGRFGASHDLIKRLNDTVRWKADGWYVFGVLRRSQERFRDALENFRFARRFYRTGFQTPRRRAELAAETARVWGELRGWNDRRVVRYLERALEGERSDVPTVQFVRGLYHRYKYDSDLERAARYFREVVDLQPQRCDALRQLVAVYEELERTEKREEIASKIEESCAD